jgi:predicted nucleotidyltransferase
VVYRCLATTPANLPAPFHLHSPRLATVAPGAIEMEKQLPIQIPHKEIADFCRRHHIHKLSLFGSILRDDFTPNSDVDMLVEFDPDHIPGYISLAGMEIELGHLLRRKVDLRAPEELSRYFRQQVLEAAYPIYVY